MRKLADSAANSAGPSAKTISSVRRRKRISSSYQPSQSGIADDRWTVEQLIETTAAYDAPHELTQFDRFIDKLADEE